MRVDLLYLDLVPSLDMPLAKEENYPITFKVRRLVISLVFCLLVILLMACKIIQKDTRDNIIPPADPSTLANASPVILSPTPLSTLTSSMQNPTRTSSPFQTPQAQIRPSDGTYNIIVGDQSYNAFPGLVKLQNGTLLTVYRKGKFHVSDSGFIVLKKSTDGGSTWSTESSVVDHPTLDLRDPNITLLSDGTLIVNYFEYDISARSTIHNGLNVIHSTDDGETWGKPIEVGTGLFVATSAPILELPDGDLLLAYYGNHEGGRYPSAFVIRSADGGRSWSNKTTIGNGIEDNKPYQEPNLLLLKTGGILATIRSDGFFPTIHTSISNDMGKTWTQPSSAFRGSGTPSTLLLESGLIITAYRSKIGRNLGLPAVRVSKDSGVSWTPNTGEIIIDRHTGPMMYASLVQISDKSIATVYGMEDGKTRSEIRFMYLREFSE